MIEEPSKTQAGDQTWEETIEQDHDAIKEILARLEATSDLHALLPLLEQLRVELLEHFEREEAPEGDYDLIANMAPDTVASLQNILGEHEHFLVRLDGLIERLRALVKGPLAECHAQKRSIICPTPGSAAATFFCPMGRSFW